MASDLGLEVIKGKPASLLTPGVYVEPDIHGMREDKISNIATKNTPAQDRGKILAEIARDEFNVIERGIIDGD